MIKAFVCDTRALTASGAEKMINETPAIAGVISARSSVRWIESAAAYILLVHALHTLGYSEIPTVGKDERGKPCFASRIGEKIGFSISHRPGVALVAIATGGECGADIEVEFDPERAARIEERYLSGIGSIGGTHCECSITVTRMDEDGNVSFDVKKLNNDYDYLQIEAKSTADTATIKWTLLEAVLKLEGSGVSGRAKFDDIYADTATAHFELCIGDERYALTLAEKNNI